MNPLITPLLSMGSKLIGNLFPDPAERAKAEAEMARMQQQGELRELEVSMSAIVMEAQSKDPWTSRARPAFLYVMYIMILAAIPMGFLFAWRPEIAQAVILGVQGWLNAIPPEMWGLFGAGYLGYVNKRSQDKQTALGQDAKPGLMSKLLG